MRCGWPKARGVSSSTLELMPGVGRKFGDLNAVKAVQVRHFRAAHNGGGPLCPVWPERMSGTTTGHARGAPFCGHCPTRSTSGDQVSTEARASMPHATPAGCPGGNPGRHPAIETIRAQEVALGIKPYENRKATLFQVAGDITAPVLAELIGITGRCRRYRLTCKLVWYGKCGEGEHVVVVD